MKGKAKGPDLDAMLVEKVAQVNETMAGRFLNSVASRLGGVLTLAAMNIACTAAFGFMVTYPIYLVGGFYAALPTGLATVAVIIAIIIAMVNHQFRLFSMKMPRSLLLLAILFSLPFGILSLPLLHGMSSTGKQRSKKSG